MLISESKTRDLFLLREPSKWNPLLKHWRGYYDLLPTIFVTMLALRVVLGIIQPSIPVQQIYIWLFVSVVIFLWQIVGTSRSIELFLKDTGNVPGVIVGYLCILTVSILTVVQVADALASANPPIETESVPGTLPLTVDEKTVRVNGSLDWELYTAFEKTLAEYPDIESVRLGSPGGYVFVARAMARIIMERQLSTHVETRCYSACTVAFLAGEQRTMADMAQIGFHKYKLEDENSSVDVAEELDKDRQFFASRGISAGFLEQVFVAEHSDLWIPEKAVLVAAGVVGAG